MAIRDEEIVELFFEVTKLNRRFSENRYGNKSPYRGQFHCLFILESTGPLPQKELAERLHIRPTSVSEILLKLEQKGFVLRTPSQQDRRSILVSLTDSGKRQAAESRKARARAHSEMLSDLSESDKAHLYVALDKIKHYYIHHED